jgi:hypothetical protein
VFIKILNEKKDIKLLSLKMIAKICFGIIVLFIGIIVKNYMKVLKLKIQYGKNYKHIFSIFGIA